MSRSNPRSSVRNTARETGRYVVSTTLGEAVQAFVPHALPPGKTPLALDGLAELNRQAELALAKLSGVSGLVPSVEWLLYSAIRKEALLTSQIEGTQATITDLLNEEAGFIVSAELVLVATLLVIGLIVGLSEVHHATVSELNDVADAIGELNQSYAYTGFHKRKSFVACDAAVTYGSDFPYAPGAATVASAAYQTVTRVGRRAASVAEANALALFPRLVPVVPDIRLPEPVGPELEGPRTPELR